MELGESCEVAIDEINGEVLEVVTEKRLSESCGAIALRGYEENTVGVKVTGGGGYGVVELAGRLVVSKMAEEGDGT